ncbi:MAG TPA: glycosyltransferase [Candidatus Paceibacterota bacterium]
MGESKQKRILIVTPRLPIPPPGACEKDRYQNILQLHNLGYEVIVLAKVSPQYDLNLAREFERETGVKIVTMPYVFMGKKNFLFYLRHLFPQNWDGAAYEYSHSDTVKTFQNLLDTFKPDLIWFDYTYLWPLYKLAKKRGMRIITRSINFEARHFLQEDGYSFLNLIRFVPKFISELITIRLSDWLFAITPDEQKTYERWACLVARQGGKGKISTLPLRGLSNVLNAPVSVKGREVLKVFFMGSTYNVHHNKSALEYVIREIAPIVELKAPGKFLFHILGKQVPDDLQKYVSGNVRYVGYQDPKIYLQDMDIAVIPSLFGAGMQQKVFEPMAMGIPLVTHERAIAGYPFDAGTHYLEARTPSEFADQIIHLQNVNLRYKLSTSAHARAKEEFSQTRLDTIVKSAIEKFT